MSDINTCEYWNKKFASDWESAGGRTQSRVFMDLILKNLPRDVHDEITQQSLSIVDAGCAEGDGTALLAQAYAGCGVTGFDFSPVAVDKARKNYPDVEFFISGFEDLDRAAGVIVVSNCLEHVSDTLRILRALARRTQRYLVVLVPYLETYPPDPEHRFQVHADTFPPEFDGWQLTHRILVAPSIVWAGYQLLMIYETPPRRPPPLLAPLPDAATVAVSLQPIRSETGTRDPRETVALGEAEQYVRALRAELESTVSALNERLVAKDHELETQRQAEAEAAAEARRQIEQLRRELSQAKDESAARHAHLQFAMAELGRVRYLGLLHLARRLRAMASRSRKWCWTLSAPGTTLYRGGRKVLPRRLAKWMRRTLAPLPQWRPRLAVQPVPPRSLTSVLPPVPAGTYDVIVLPIIDWDFRFQRPQQIATQFARRGHRVFYLSTTRFVLEDGPDWNLVHKIDGVAELQIRARQALDVYGGHLGSQDLEVLVDAFGRLARSFAIGDAVCQVHAPFWWPLAHRLRERFGWRVMYDCMDDWTNFPGLTKEVLALEHELVRQADLTVVPALRLVEKWQPLARKLALVPNGVDLTHYRALYAENAILDGVTHPVIGYFGALAKWVDVPLLEKIARRHPEATLVLAGGHFDVDLSPIASLPNVWLLGQRAYEDMPRLLWNFDVCIIPFLVNDITEATNPVKFYEYLFGGRPIVAPALSEVEPFANISYLARDHEGFLEQIGLALAERPDDPRREARRRLAEINDWSVRQRVMDDASLESFPLVSVIVVSYGTLELTKACLDSLRNVETWPRLEIIVVDNASPDETPGYLRSLAARDARVGCLINAQNRGFPAATNQGIRQATGDILVLLNNDTVVPAGLIGRLVRHLTADESIGLVCPMTNFCGNEARIEPGYADLSELPTFAAERAHQFAGQTFDIAVAAMYCVAARSEVVRAVGPLDEAFGIGLFEDDDFSMRVRQAGYRVVCARDAYVHHVGQGSFRSLSAKEYSTLWEQNQAHFESKWGIPWTPHTTAAGVSPPR